MNSSDWWANEKECNDSEGNRLRSSVKFNVGDDGPEGNPIETARDKDKVKGIEFDIEFERSPSEVVRDGTPLEGTVGARLSGCWRIHRSPECGFPRSCSVIMDDLPRSALARLSHPVSNMI